MEAPDTAERAVVNNAGGFSRGPQSRGPRCARKGIFQEPKPSSVKEAAIPPSILFCLTEVPDNQTQDDKLIHDL
jgi:hypothetical protein